MTVSSRTIPSFLLNFVFWPRADKVFRYIYTESVLLSQLGLIKAMYCQQCLLVSGAIWLIHYFDLAFSVLQGPNDKNSIYTCSFVASVKHLQLEL